MKHASPNKPETMNAKLLVVVGETASGKSALAMELARQFGGEIICADSVTVYTGFDIGAAKPSKNDQSTVPHHGLDVADPTTGYSAAAFKYIAEEAIRDIATRGKVPIMVGGSGLYIDSVLYDYQFLSIPNTYKRDVLNTMSVSDLQDLARSRGINLLGVDTSNPRRMIRALETGGKRAQRISLRPETCIIGLQMSREELRSRVELRVESMLQAGLEAEVRRLSTRFGWDCEAMKAVGYREWRAYFAGHKTRAEIAVDITAGTMRLAKKQRTWFKRNNSIQWVSDPSEAVEIATTFLNK